MRYQPDLYRLPARVGKFPKGTIICSGNSIPTDLSQTKIDVYASVDEGYTWKFVSSVASGGAAFPNNGVPAIWEPFVMYYKGQVVLYFSDQRDSLYGQKLLHSTSKDLLNWSATVDDVHYPTYTDRPGMTTVVLLPNGKYFMAYVRSPPGSLFHRWRLTNWGIGIWRWSKTVWHWICIPCLLSHQLKPTKVLGIAWHPTSHEQQRPTKWISIRCLVPSWREKWNHHCQFRVQDWSLCQSGSWRSKSMEDCAHSRRSLVYTPFEGLEWSQSFAHHGRWYSTTQHHEQDYRQCHWHQGELEEIELRTFGNVVGVIWCLG